MESVETGACLRYPFAEPFDVVLAADCVYDVELVGPLVRAIAAGVGDGGRGLVAIDASIGRSRAYAAFERLARATFATFVEIDEEERAAWSQGDDKSSLRLYEVAGPRGRLAPAPRVVLMGPCGCGKTRVGRALAAALGLPFLEGDGPARKIKPRHDL